MKETVLLTGGAGFIGSHIAVELLQRDYNVVIADDLSNARPDVPERIRQITGRAPAVYHMDAADRPALDRVFREHPIAAAVHLAGYKAVGESVQKPLAYYRNNLDTTLALLDVMADHGVHRLIFSSSATVYGDAPAPCRGMELHEKLFSLIHPGNFVKNISSGIAESKENVKDLSSRITENFAIDVASLREQIFNDATANFTTPVDRLNQNERKEIMIKLYEQGLFQLKGSIPFVAKRFSCSQATIYRYLGEINN